MKRVYGAMVIAGVMVSALACLPAAAASTAARNLIHTEGSAEVAGQNDSAGISLAVVSEGRELDMVTADNAARTKQVLQAVDDLKIEGLKAKTANFRVDPQSDYKVRPSRIVGFKVYNAVDLTLEGVATADLSRHVSSIIGATLQNGANSVQTLHFYIRNREQLERDALAEATRDAVARAKVLAEAAGVKLKRIASISTQPSQPVPVRMMDRGFAMAAEATAPPPIESGESVIRADVQITYEIQ